MLPPKLSYKIGVCWRDINVAFLEIVQSYTLKCPEMMERRVWFTRTRDIIRYNSVLGECDCVCVWRGGWPRLYTEGEKCKTVSSYLKLKRAYGRA